MLSYLQHLLLIDQFIFLVSQIHLGSFQKRLGGCNFKTVILASPISLLENIRIVWEFSFGVLGRWIGDFREICGAPKKWRPLAASLLDIKSSLVWEPEWVRLEGWRDFLRRIIIHSIIPWTRISSHHQIYAAYEILSRESWISSAKCEVCSILWITMLASFLSK